MSLIPPTHPPLPAKTHPISGLCEVVPQPRARQLCTFFWSFESFSVYTSIFNLFYVVRLLMRFLGGGGHSFPKKCL